MSPLDLEEALEITLYGQDPLVRDAARGALIERGTVATVKALARALDAPHKSPRRRAARALSEMRPALVQPVLRPILRDPEQPARPRSAAARVLSILAEDREPALGDGLSDGEIRVRRACATPAAPRAALILALSDVDDEVASRAAQALLGESAPLPAEALGDAVAARQARGDDVPPALIRAAAKASADGEALIPLAEAGEAVALDHLAHRVGLAGLLGGPHRASAAWGLARIGDADALAALAGDPDPIIRGAAARGLPGDHPALAALLDDPDPAVAWLAAKTQRGAFAPEVIAGRLGPHSRSEAVSAKPPYGIGPDDAPPTVARPPSALALCQTRFDVNLGVAVRSAEAAGLQEVWLVGQGGLFRSPARGTDRVIPVHGAADPEALIRAARQRGYQIVVVQQTPDSEPYHTAHYPPRPMFVMGAEDVGVPEALRAAADLIVEIPMFGVIDSLNVAAAATCVMFQWRLSMGRLSTGRLSTGRLSTGRASQEPT